MCGGLCRISWGWFASETISCAGQRWIVGGDCVKDYRGTRCGFIYSISSRRTGARRWLPGGYLCDTKDRGRQKKGNPDQQQWLLHRAYASSGVRKAVVKLAASCTCSWIWTSDMADRRTQCSCILYVARGGWVVCVVGLSDVNHGGMYTAQRSASGLYI